MLRLVGMFLRSFGGNTPLRGVDIALSYNCNLNCEHCNVALLRNQNREPLSVAEIVGLIQRAKGLGLVNITFTGGEPLLEYHKLTSILQAIDTGSYLIHIQTNATLLTEERIIELKALGVDKFILSFDPYHESNDWDEMLAARRRLVKLIKKHGLKTIAVAVAARDVIHTEPFLRMVDVTRDLGIWLVLNLPVPLGRWLQKEEILLRPEDQLYVRDLVAQNSHVRLDFDLNFLQYGCPAFTERFHVNAYGDVQPCTFSQVTFGNVRTDDLREIRARGLKNRIFNTYRSYCPPAEDPEFIEQYSAAMVAKDLHPLPAEEIFDHQGRLKGSSPARSSRTGTFTSETSCDLCGANRFQVLLAGVKDYEYALPGSWDVVQCCQCDLVRLEPFPTFAETLDFYPANYVQFSPRQGQIVGPLYRGFVLNQGKIMEKLVGSRARVLDVGAACGEFMKILQEAYPGWEITGLEPNPEAVATGRRLWGLDLRQGTLETADLPEESFDLVILTHVIEHVVSPSDTLARLHRLLKPGGWVYGETENIDAPDARILGRYWGLFHIPRHLYFFTPETLRKVAAKVGFLIPEVIQTFNPGSWALGWQFLLEERLFQRVTPGRTAYFPLLLLAAMPLMGLQLLLGQPSPAIRFIGQKN